MKILINNKDACDFDQRKWIIRWNGGDQVHEAKFQCDWEAALVLDELMGHPDYQQVDVIEP